MNEQQFEECSLEDATHVEVNGVRHELNDNVQYFCNGDLLGIRWRDEYTFIPEELFSTLGIQPLREVKPKPIEFIGYTQYFTNCISHIMNVPEGVPAGTKFKCVQIVEED